MRSMVTFTACMAFIMAMDLSGCGGVDVAQQGPEPLTLMELTPHDKELDVSPVVDVVAVFSAPVTLGEGDSNLNEQTFFVRKDGGNKLGTVVTLVKSGSDESLDSGDTARIRLDDLEAGGTYTIFVSGKLTGKDTGPIGIDIHTSFTVRQ